MGRGRLVVGWPVALQVDGSCQVCLLKVIVSAAELQPARDEFVAELLGARPEGRSRNLNASALAAREIPGAIR